MAKNNKLVNNLNKKASDLCDRKYAEKNFSSKKVSNLVGINRR